MAYGNAKDMNEEQLKERYKDTMKALAEYGVYSKEDLNRAIENMPPLNVSCMTVPLKD